MRVRMINCILVLLFHSHHVYFHFVVHPGIREAFENKKIGSLIGVEGGHNFDSQMSVLRMLYELGVRYITVTHSCNTPWLVTLFEIYLIIHTSLFLYFTLLDVSVHPYSSYYVLLFFHIG